ncbi:uncharacterized protein MELLADRAFT_90219 [Melampsora larici-populina 98AG31]|uniref:Uncharacterized protein n=1 Tax=Melampsora larici-populina (strain 98AG31 / pathotype 3-4-7) TaxID=747676 RepID=F4RW54_MELLP|nr:uncharacterized protein MELLADRAFT_90219 [Melampsora larici-populina 98AG31]EGG03377.1 hypothetical protein MELLADRAFT_90219 [Melampsora larici-populina 98AG31]
MDTDTRTIYSKKDIGEKISEYLAEQGLSRRDGKGVETQIRTLEAGFTLAQDFRSGTGQGILEDFEQQAQTEKSEMGYSSDSDEWKAIQQTTKSKFDQLLFQRSIYYYDLLPFMSTRTNVIPQAVRESGDHLDEETVLPSTKRARNQSPISIVSSTHESHEIETTPWESPLDLDEAITQIVVDSPGSFSASQNRQGSPTPNNLNKKGGSGRPPGRPSKRPNSLQFNNQGAKSTSSSASDVQQLLASHLPSREEKAEKNKLEKERWNFEEKYMKAEQEARKEEIQTQAKLADAVARHLSGANDGLDTAERAQRSQLKLEQDRVQLELSRSQLARSREDLITARSERKLSMLAKYKALGFSIEEAKKEVEEAEDQIRTYPMPLIGDLEGESQGSI